MHLSGKTYRAVGPPAERCSHWEQGPQRHPSLRARSLPWEVQHELPREDGRPDLKKHRFEEASGSNVIGDVPA